MGEQSVKELAAKPMLYPYKAAKVADLIPYARNARTHSDEQIAQIAASIREFGFINPVIVDGDKGVIAGHGRILAARKLGLKELPTLEVSGLSKAQKRAYILADNKLAMNAGWDNDLLKVELADLQTDGFDLDLIGFSADEIRVYLDNVAFAPGGEADQGRLDELEPRWIACPHCGKEFNAREA